MATLASKDSTSTVFTPATGGNAVGGSLITILLQSLLRTILNGMSEDILGGSSGGLGPFANMLSLALSEVSRSVPPGSAILAKIQAIDSAMFDLKELHLNFRRSLKLRKGHYDSKEQMDAITKKMEASTSLMQKFSEVGNALLSELVPSLEELLMNPGTTDRKGAGTDSTVRSKTTDQGPEEGPDSDLYKGYMDMEDLMNRYNSQYDTHFDNVKRAQKGSKNDTEDSSLKPSTSSGPGTKPGGTTKAKSQPKGCKFREKSTNKKKDDDEGGCTCDFFSGDNTGDLGSLLMGFGMPDLDALGSNIPVRIRLVAV